MMVDDRNVSFTSDYEHLATELVFAPERGDVAILRDHAEEPGSQECIEFYVYDPELTRSPIADGAPVAINTHTARQLAAELLNRADRIDDLIGRTR